MSEFNHQPPPGDVLDRAAAAVQGAAVPDPPADLLVATLAAVHNRLALAGAADVARRRRRKLVMRATGVGGLAAALAVAWVAVAPPSAVALDPVIQKMKAAESARYTVVQTLGDQPPLTQKFWVRGDRMRVEFSDAATVIVTDLKLKQGLLTVPSMKRFDRLPRPGQQIEVGDGKTPLDQFLSIRDAKAERLGKEQVGGIQADKMKVERPAANGYQASTWTVWLDPATTLPVKIVSAGTVVTGDKTVPAEAVFTDFAWNERFADDLFALDPPAGYAEGMPGRAKPSAEKTQQVSLMLALENQEKAKSFRAVVKTAMPGLPGGGSVPEQKLFVQGDNMRFEMGDVVSVSDGKRLVLLDAKAKVARTTTVADVGDTELAKGVAAGVRKVLDAQDGKGAATPVPAVEIGGKKRPGFRVAGVEVGPGQAADVTYYLDEEKKLPLRYEFVLTGPVKMTSTTDYLGFDEELNPKLFSLDIPPGYKVEELKLPADKK